MVKEKDIRPTRARLLGDIIPSMSTLLTKTSYEDFHTKRTSGGNVKYKNETVSTLNLNSTWVDTSLEITSITGMTINNQGQVSVKLFKEADNTPIANENISITIGTTVFTCKTNTSGIATANWTPSTPGTYNVTAEYGGNAKKSYKKSETVTSSFTVSKLDVTITQANLTGVIGDTFTITPTLKDSNGNNVNGGTLEYKYGDYQLGSATVTDGTCSFTRTISQAVEYTYWLKYNGTSIYNTATKNFKITVNRKTPSITINTANSTLSTDYDGNLVVQVQATSGGGTINLTNDGVVLKLYDGDTELGTFTNNGTTATCTISPSWVGTKTLTVKLAESTKYTATTKTVSTTVTKSNTSVDITLDDIWDFPDTSGFNVKVRNSKNQYVTGGTLTLVFTQETINEQSTVATYNLAETGGNITVTRGNLDLDSLYSTVRQRRYLYYTGYKVTATYSGNTYYNGSSQEKQPVNIHAYASIIAPVFVINSNADYDISADYSRVPTDSTSLGNFHLKIEQHENRKNIIRNNRAYGFDQDTPINMGTVSRGQIIWVATEYIASHTDDSSRNANHTEQLSIPGEAVGGINTEIHYKINNADEQDTAEAQLNGSTTRYTIPRYTKFSIPNTVNAGDTIQLIFYTGRNAGYYDMYNSTYGFRYAFQWEVE